MSDEKKDLTGILDLPASESGEKPSEESSATHEPDPSPLLDDPFADTMPVEPEPSAAATTAEPPSEQLDKFESLEEYSHATSANEEPAPESAATSEPLPDMTAAPEAAPPSAMDAIKTFSDNLPVGQSSVPAVYPFSLFITGVLTPQEKEKLMDILSRENMGIREVDLEPQFQGNRVLIPRVSEYAGVLIVQAMRGAKAEIRLAPSDAASAEESEQPLSAVHSESHTSSLATEEIEHPAERMPLTNDSALPDLPRFSVVGVVTASAALKTTVVEAERSAEYQEILEALQRELRYKAYRKGAAAILNFSVTLNRLTLPTGYRLSVMGTAIQPAKPDHS